MTTDHPETPDRSRPVDGLPLNTGACLWVVSRVGRPLTEPEQELVTVLCAALRTGPWNVHRTWGPLRGDAVYAKMFVGADLASTDSDGLTGLVLAAADRCVRVSINSGGPRGVRVSLSLRRERVGWQGVRVPTIETVVAEWRDRYPVRSSPRLEVGP